MDHVVYLDAQAIDLDNLLNGSKTILIRRAFGRKLPHDRVHAENILYFINNNAEKTNLARGVVTQAFHSDKLTEAKSLALIAQNQPKLRLTKTTTTLGRETLSGAGGSGPS